MISKAVSALQDTVRILAFLKENWIFHKLGSVLSLWLESVGFLVVEFSFTQLDSKGQSVLKTLFHIESYLQKSLKCFSERGYSSQATDCAGSRAGVHIGTSYHMCEYVLGVH